MSQKVINWYRTKHLKFLSFLSGDTLSLLKEQVYRTLRDQEKDELFEQFINWQNNESEIMLYSDYSSFCFDLPMHFDSIFANNILEERIDVDVYIPYSILNGWAAINSIEKGHRNVCLLKFAGKIPDIVKFLPEVNNKSKNNKYEIILFNQVDIEFENYLQDV